MSAWYGESCAIDYGMAVSGPAPAEPADLYYRSDGKSVTTVASNSFTIGAYYTGWLLEYSDVAVVSWVIEFGPATAGTVHLHSGLDPLWNYDPTVCIQDLGEHTVTGEQTFISAPTSITTADLLDFNDEPTLFFEQVAGTSQIVQIKLRVWPADGPRGAWTPVPDSVDTSTVGYATAYRRLGDAAVSANGSTSVAELVYDETGYDEAAALAQTRAQANLQVLDGTPQLWESTGSIIANASAYATTQPWFHTSTLLHGYTALAGVMDSPGLLWAKPSGGPVLPDNIGYDPREIYDEADNSSYYQTLDGQPATGQFAGWTGDLVVAYNGTYSGEAGGVSVYYFPTGSAALAQSPGSESDVGAWTGFRWEGTYHFVVGGAQNAISPDSPYDVNGTIFSSPIAIFGGPLVWVTARPPGITNIAVPDPAFSPTSSIDPNTGTPMYDYRVGSNASVQPGPNGLRFRTAFEPLRYFDPSLPWETPSVPLTGTSSTDTGEYVYEGDVGAGPGIPPILWFVYKKWGFLGQHYVAYGQGLGNSQPALNGKLFLGPGDSYPISGDIRPTLAAWSFNPASDHAYDGTGVIFPGTDIAPPRVDAEVQTVEFIVPSDMPLEEPTEFHIYVTNDNGTSNALSLMLYPMIDVNMESGEPILMTTAAGMGEHGLDVLADEEGPSLMAAAVAPNPPHLTQRYSRISFPYTLTGQVPERAPVYLTNAKPAFALTGGERTTGLDDPVNVPLPMALRYRPLDSKISARPDLGTGMSVWNSNESSSMDWKFNVASAPYVDVDNVISSRNGELVRPAMVFPGNAWAETTASFPAGPKLTLMMAVTIYPDVQQRSYLLSSFVAGVPDPDTFPFEVYLEGDQVSFVIGTKHQVVRIASGYIGQRPVIIGVSMTASTLRMAVVSNKASIVQVSHVPLNASGFRLYMGRCNDAGSLQMATMDVLDLGVDNVTPAGPDRFWSIINRLDGIYGVMK